jgi:uncharacterized membrane protein
MAKLNKWLTILLIAAILASIAGIVYLVSVPRLGDRFTEFYILSPEGKAGDIHKEIALGESAEILVGIVNHEGTSASYRFTLTIEGDLYQDINVGVLSDGAKWEQKVIYIPRKSGNQQQLELTLYKDTNDHPYHKEPLRLFIDVIPR